MCIRDRYGAVHAALIKPDVYGKVFSYSGLLDIEKRFDNPQGINTVSYTHLDVYKRQQYICVQLLSHIVAVKTEK